MFSKIGQLIFDNEAVAKTSDFTMGLEIEMQRVDDTGHLSQEPYPSAIGDEKTNPWITNDFLETMSEVVTPAANHALDAMHYLYAINNVLRSALAPGELLWPLSMPPKLPKDKSTIQTAKMGPVKEAYLKEFIKRHGFSKGTPCGAHINLSIDDHIIDLVLKNFPERFKNRIEVQNYLYIVFHSPVRFKGTKDFRDLPKKGVQYLELRMLDLDPSSSVGVRTGTLRFIRLLSSYFIMHPALKTDDVDQVLSKADEMNEDVSVELPTDQCKYQNKARAFIKSLERFANQIQLGPEYQEILEDLEDRVENPKTTPSAKLLSYVENNSLEKYALRRAKRYQEAALESIYQFKGFEDDAPMSAEDLKRELFYGNWEVQ